MTQRETPWTEKYRPSRLDGITMGKKSFHKISTIIENKDMPHIIIVGVPGTGKTTTIKCIGSSLLGKYSDEYVMELNASDDRGIKVVQEKMTQFCKKKIEINVNDKDKYSNHKIILLDEADGITLKAQRLINNLIEKYGDTTRFAFTCNDSSKIIEGIQSRCITFYYKRLDKEQIEQKLKKICEREQVKYDDEGIESLLFVSQGDLRAAINNLQIVHSSYGMVNADNIYRLFDKPHPSIIENLFLMCSKGDYVQAFKMLHELTELGYSNSDISLSMVETLKNIPRTVLTESTKIKYLTEVGRTALNISKGIDTYLQLTGCIAKLCML